MHPHHKSFFGNARTPNEFQQKDIFARTPMARPQHYSRTQIVLHWLIAGLILIQLTINADMQQAFAQRLASGVLPANAGAIFHAVVGIAVLVLACLRLMLRLRLGTPAPNSNTGMLVHLLSVLTHWLLYGFLFFMPLTGALAWFFGIELAGIAHELGRLILIPAILLHAAGAMVEELVLDNRVVGKMLPGKRDIKQTR
jgi:cytochrome b561